MTKTVKEEIKLARAAGRYWYWFMLTSAELDRTNDKPNGWHWFWGLDYLHQEQNKFPKFDVAKIQNTVHDKHWLKKVSISNLPPVRGNLRNLVAELSSYLKTDGYSKIDFSRYNNEINNNFSNFIFPIKVSFEKSGFFADANFKNTVFLKDALFSDTTFFKDARFNDIKFLKNAFFSNAKFFENADFENAEFQKKEDSKFYEEADFYKKTAKFRNTIFKKIANFRNAKFWNYANFKGANFGGRTIFQQARFELHAPRFYGAEFNNELILNRIELPESKKFTRGTVNGNYQKTIDTSKDAYEDYQKTIEENKSAYETLIYLMEKQNKHHDKHRFFREEMRWRQFGNKLTKERRLAYLHERRDEYPALLRIEHNSEILFFCLYDKISDYGYGIGRTFSWWLGHILAGLSAIFAVAFFNSCWGFYEILFCSTSVSLSNANPFVFAIINDGKLMECYNELNDLSPIFFGTIRGLQTFFGIALLFLLLTTLRVRFRLGGTNSNTTINNTIETTSEK